MILVLVFQICGFRPQFPPKPYVTDHMGLFHVRRIFSIPSAMDAHTAGVHSFAEAVMMNSTPEPR